ncbi:Retrotransposon nucleocapsid protein, related [Eimeria mitis]|uniref:Retrotransposon nucleocapsid protein, related n=1 Tax=Eimeria mitis TaxID=44415 RepID=U6KK80_9EIME|nr:Retrotransposon nucleocapsid protein, related [Eimeria mitis]CDJ35833.1 Retrotransposon nucleocapsid protein, related [Eimeria mitis]
MHPIVKSYRRAGRPREAQCTTSSTFPGQPQASFQGTGDPHLEEEIERKADELLRKGKVQPSSSGFWHSHGGINTTVEHVARSFWWPRMRPSVEEYVLSCPDRQQQKPRNTDKPGFLHSLPIPDRIWTDIPMDFIVGLSPVRGHDSIYVVVDRLSKYAHFIPFSSSATAEGVAQLFINHMWKLHAFPKSIISDKDRKFFSAFWRSLMQRLNIDHNMTTASHPESDGQTERTNRTLVQYLQLYIQHNSSNWLDFLACAENHYSAFVHPLLPGVPGPHRNSIR